MSKETCSEKERRGGTRAAILSLRCLFGGTAPAQLRFSSARSSAAEPVDNQNPFDPKFPKTPAAPVVLFQAHTMSTLLTGHGILSGFDPRCPGFLSVVAITSLRWCVAKWICAIYCVIAKRFFSWLMGRFTRSEMSATDPLGLHVFEAIYQLTDLGNSYTRLLHWHVLA